MRHFLLALGLFCFVLPRNAQAGDPRLKWRTLETKHFEVVFALRDLEAAKRVAVLCEAAHRLLTPYMKRKPRGRTKVLLTDYTDGANGLAMVLPRNFMRLFLSAPDSLSTLNDHDDWLFALIVHEYTHILHLDTIGGIAKVINWIFGKTYAPNHLQPGWFIEGFATLNESAFTSGGRVRSSTFDMILRAAVLAGKPLDLGELSSAPIRFPFGTSPYLYGSRFLHYLASRFGDKALAKISHDYGSQWLPYGLNKIARRHLKGRGYVSLYRDFLAHLRRRYRLQARIVRRQGLTRAKRLTKGGNSTFWPRFHPTEDWLVVADDDGNTERALKRIDPATGKQRKIRRLEPGGASAFTPDGRALVISQMEVRRAIYDFSDLYRLDLESGRYRRLTHGQRLREPHVSPDGRRIVCVINRGGTTSVALVPIDGLRKGAKPTILVQSRSLEQAATPAWSPDGRHIVYAGWRHGGYRDLFLVEVETRRVRRLTHDRAQDLGPIWSPDGRYIYYSSDRSGIYNVYALEPPSGRVRQVTNVIGGALQPAVSHDGKRLAYIDIGPYGYDLWVTGLDPKRFRDPPPYVSNRPRARRIPDAKPTQLEIKRYNPLSSLAPQAWFFSLSTAPGAESLTLLIDGSDIAELHRWDLAGTYNFGSAGFNFGFAYSYNQLWPGLGVSASYGRGPRGGLTIDGAPELFTEQSAIAQANLTLPVLRSRRWGSATIRVSYRFQYFAPTRKPPPTLDPSALITQGPERGKLSGFTLALGYSRIRRYLFSVSPQSGRSVGVSVNYNHEALGSDFRTTSFTWSWQEYITMPWAKLHVLYLRLAGGISRGNLRRRALFSIGGVPGQDIVQSLIDVTPLAGNFLRGYPAFGIFGDQFHLLNVEYRFPITWINWGPETLPIYFRRLYGSVFADAGNAFFGELKAKELKVGVGAELVVDLIIGYYQWLTFRLGYAYGIMDPGGHSYYFIFGVPF